MLYVQTPELLTPAHVNRGIRGSIAKLRHATRIHVRIMVYVVIIQAVMMAITTVHVHQDTPESIVKLHHAT